MQHFTHKGDSYWSSLSDAFCALLRFFYCRLFLIHWLRVFLIHWLRLLLFQSRVTLECVYDLKPRYFVRPTIMMTSLKQTKVANKRDKRKIRKHKNSKNEKLRSSGIKKGGKIHFTRIQKLVQWSEYATAFDIENETHSFFLYGIRE